MSESHPPSITRKQRSRRKSHVFLSLLGIVLLGLLLNVLVARHPYRLHLTEATQFDLTPLSQRVLTALTNDVEVTVFFDHSNPVFGHVDELLKEYALRSPNLQIRVVDYLQSFGKAQEIAQNLDLDLSKDEDVVVFRSENRKKVVRASELSDMEFIPTAPGAPPEARRSAFKGERHFTAAIVSVADASKPKAYFLQGHGEHDPTSDSEQSGYSSVARALEERNIEVAIFDAKNQPGLPDDRDHLIVAGPVRPLSENTLAAIHNYLLKGGRLLALVNYTTLYGRNPTGLRNLLQLWGIEAGRNVASDPENSANNGNVIMVKNYQSHSIVKPLIDQALYLVRPCSVSSTTPSKPVLGQTISTLIKTGPKGLTGSSVQNDNSILFDPNVDKEGEIPLAVAMEKGTVRGLAAATQPTRIVAIGDSLAFVNVLVENRDTNRDFISLSANWLLARNDLIEIGPRAIEEYRITLSEAQMTQAKWALLGALPGSVLFMGVLVWILRRG